MTCRQAVGSRRFRILFAATLAGLAGLTASTASAEDVTVNLRQAQANRLSYFHDNGISALGTTADHTPAQAYNGGLVAPLLPNSVSSSDSSSTDKSWFVSKSSIFGFDSNPQGTAGGRSSVFTGADLTGRYTWSAGGSDPVVGAPTMAFVSYNAQGAVYEGQVGRSDEIQQTGLAGGRQSFFKDTLVLYGLLADQFTVDQGRAFLNTLDIAPGVEFFAFPRLSIDLSYDFTHLTYFYPVRDDINPDAERNTASILLHFYSLPQLRGVPLPKSPDQLTDILRAMLYRANVGYAHITNVSSGDSYRYEGNRIIVGLDGVRIRAMANTTFDLNYSHEWRGYTRKTSETPVIINSASGTFLRRNDSLDVFTLRGNSRLLHLAHNAGDINGFLQWDVIGNTSNVGKRAFNEFIIGGGLTYRF